METQLRILDEKNLERLLFNRSIYRKKAQKIEPSFEDFLVNITKWIISIIECTGVYFFMDDPLNKRLKLSKNRLILVSQFSKEDSLVGMNTSANSNNCVAKAYREKEIINHPSETYPPAQFDQKFNSKSYVAVPIQIQGSPIGVLVLTKNVTTFFSERKYGLLNIIAEFIGTTIANFLDNNRCRF